MKKDGVVVIELVIQTVEAQRARLHSLKKGQNNVSNAGEVYTIVN